MSKKNSQHLGIVRDFLSEEGCISFPMIADRIDLLTEDEECKVLNYVLYEIFTREEIKMNLTYKISTVSDLLPNICNGAYIDPNLLYIIEYLYELPDFIYYSDKSKRCHLGDPPSAFIAQNVKKQFMYHFLGMYRKQDMFKLNKLRRRIVAEIVKIINAQVDNTERVIYNLYCQLVLVEHLRTDIVLPQIELSVGRYKSCCKDGYADYLKICKNYIVKSLVKLEDMDNLVGRWEEKNGECWDYRSKAGFNEVYVSYINKRLSFGVAGKIRNIRKRKCRWCNTLFFWRYIYCCIDCKNSHRKFTSVYRSKDYYRRKRKNDN